MLRIDNGKPIPKQLQQELNAEEPLLLVQTNYFGRQNLNGETGGSLFCLCTAGLLAKSALDSGDLQSWIWPALFLCAGMFLLVSGLADAFTGIWYAGTAKRLIIYRYGNVSSAEWIAFDSSKMKVVENGDHAKKIILPLRPSFEPSNSPYQVELGNDAAARMEQEGDWEAVWNFHHHVSRHDIAHHRQCVAFPPTSSAEELARILKALTSRKAA